MAATVYVVQEPMQWDPVKQQKHRKFDLTPAAEYGCIRFLFDENTLPLNPAFLVDRIHEQLFDYDDNDYILPTGHPVAIGLAVAIAANYNAGWVNLLYWSNREKRYISTRANVYGTRD